MTNDKGILIKNIFYMLTYAFQVLKQDNYKSIMSNLKNDIFSFKSIMSEQFDNIQNLFAEILSKGISKQLKQGLYREYISYRENLSVVKGKINITKTINNKIQIKRKVFCEHDELSENNIFNQILKTACEYLIKDKTVEKKYKDELKQILMFFGNINIVDYKNINWKRLVFQKNNQSYKMLIYICYFLFDCLVPTTEEGKYKFKQFSEENMARLYEKFVLNYYIYHHSSYLDIKSEFIEWALDKETTASTSDFLPQMHTDIMLKSKDKTLIIDTKYYSSIYQTRYDRETFRSNNLYQIFAYVRNYDNKNTGNTAGMLLYAKTKDIESIDEKFVISNNTIAIKTLDLNKDFNEISDQLNQIVFDYFGKHDLTRPHY